MREGWEIGGGGGVQIVQVNLRFFLCVCMFVLVREEERVRS